MIPFPGSPDLEYLKVLSLVEVSRAIARCIKWGPSVQQSVFIMLVGVDSGL